MALTTTAAGSLRAPASCVRSSSAPDVGRTPRRPPLFDADVRIPYHRAEATSPARHVWCRLGEGSVAEPRLTGATIGIGLGWRSRMLVRLPERNEAACDVSSISRTRRPTSSGLSN